MSRRDETVIKNDAYGQVQFSRISGGNQVLYGSAMKQHGTKIELSIKRSELIHDLSYDRYHPKEELIRVVLSAAQFAELLTTMNYGSGIPCTITRVNNESVPPLNQKTPTETDRIETGFQERCQGLVDKLRGRVNKARDILSKSRVNKGDRQEVTEVLDWVMREVASGIPYVETSFKEAAERVKTAAKAEVDAFMSHAITTAGLEKLSGGGEDVVKRLEVEEEE